MWKHVSCPHILKFNGVFYYNDAPAIVTPWMPHGNITEYVEKHADADRLDLVSSDFSSTLNISSLPAFRYAAFRCGKRSKVPPQWQHSAWGYQGRKPSSPHERFDYEAIISPVKYPHFGFRSTPGHARRLRFNPRYDHLGGIAGRWGRNILDGSRAPPPNQIRSRQRDSV